MKIYSIIELVEATNNILNSENMNKSDTSKKSEEIIKQDLKPLVLTESISSKQEQNNTEPLVLTEEVNSFPIKINPRESIPKDTVNIIEEAEENLRIEKQKKINHKLIKNNTTIPIKINIKDNIKENMVNELYTFIKKKIKKNTLKLIIEQQLENKNLKNKINSLNHNFLNINNDLKNVLENNEILQTSNEILQSKLEEVIEKNKSLESNNFELKNLINSYIESHKKLEIEINILKSDQSKNLVNNEKFKGINQKIKFFQDENVRLSSELSLFQNKYNVTIKNFKNIEKERTKISEQIKNLTNSISKTDTNIINTKFNKETNEPKPLENLNFTKNPETNDLDFAINKIFKK